MYLYIHACIYSYTCTSINKYSGAITHLSTSQAYPPATISPPLPSAPGPDINYLAIIDTLTRDVVADSNMISDLQKRQQQLLSQQGGVADSVCQCVFV